jgi:hypothetical protein
MEKFRTSDPHPARRASLLARVGLAGLIAAAALAGGLQLVGRSAAAPVAADELSQGSLAQGQIAFLPSLPPSLPPHGPLWPMGPQATPIPQATPPRPPAGPPTLSVLDDENQTAQRLMQGENISLWVTGFQPGPVFVGFDAQPLGTVTQGSTATFTMPYNRSAGHYGTFIASQGSLQAMYTVWFDYAPQ